MGEATIQELNNSQASNLPAVLCNALGLSLAMASLATAWPTGHIAWTVFMITWLAYFQHTWMTVFHGEAHYAVYKNKWQNIRGGTIIGTLLMVPFTAYRQVHIRHHAKMNMPDDFELWPYCDPQKSLRFRRIFVILDLLFGWWLGTYIYGRILFVHNSPIKDPKIRRRIIFEYLGIIVFWSAVLGLVAYFGAWMFFLKVYVIPAWLTGSFQAVRKLTEHLGLPAGDAMGGARTILNHSLMGRFVAYINFNIVAHGLHHLFPQMPHQNLDKAFETLESPPAEVVFTSYSRAMLDTARYLWNPGIGANISPIPENASV